MNSNNRYINSNHFFYFMFGLTVVALLLTNPFLKYPYDMFTHLQMIDEQSGASAFPEKRVFWHYIWARIFDFFHISRTQIFLRAHIIHYVQIVTTFITVFYFSKIFIRNIFKEISYQALNYLSFWSTIIWFTVLSNASEKHQQVWILWYSINYQIALPLTLLAFGITLSILIEHGSKKLKAIQIMVLMLLLYLILRIHAMEFIYYMMYIVIFILVYVDKIFQIAKKYYYYFIPLLLLLY
ncbi:MAG: hypothetical protein DSZ10_00270, partial [Sulfurovum sp.]